MKILLCDSFWTDVFPSIWWGSVVVVVIIWLLFVIGPLIKLKEQNRHEKMMKDDAFRRELKWHFIKIAEKPIEIEGQLKNIEEQLEKCQKELKMFKKKETELNEGTETLKKEKEQLEKEILEAKIKAYEEVIKTIN